MKNNPCLEKNARPLRSGAGVGVALFASPAGSATLLSLPAWVLLLFLGATRVGAGEAIQFTPGKSKVASELDNRLSKDKASAPARRASVAELGPGIDNPLLSAPSVARRNRAEEKKAKNTELEKKNWILFNRGELQEKEEATGGLGVRDYDGEGIEKEKTVGEIWFTPPRDDRSKGPSQPSRINTARPSPPGPHGNAPKASDRAGEERPVDIEPSRLSGKEGRDAQQNTGSLKDVEVRDTLTTDAQDGALKDLFNARAVQIAEPRRDASGPSATAAATPGTAPLVLGKGFGLGSDNVPSAGGTSPLLDGSRRSTPLGPPGPALGGSTPLSRAPGVSSSGGFLGSGFGSGFQNSFGNAPGANNNASRNDQSPGSSRRTFDSPIRR